MKKIIIMLISIFLLSGCTDYVEINDLAIISGIAIDYENDLYKLTAQLIENDKESKVVVLTTASSSIDEAMSEISKLSNKELFISHLKVLILSDRLIKENKDFYDYFLRSSKSKMNFYTYIASKDEISSIFKIYSDKNSSSIYLDKMMDFNQNIFSSSTPLKFIDMIYNKYEYGINNVYPTITIKKNNDEETLYLGNLVSFNSKLNKLTFSEKESIFYNIITNNSQKTTLDIPCGNKLFTIEVQDIKTKFNWNKNVFTINTKSLGKLKEYNCNYNLNSKETTNKLNKLTNDYIKNNINNLINKMKKNNNDFIGIGNYIYKRNKNYFDFKNKNWDDNLKNINIEIKSNTKINSSGEIRK